MPGIAWAVIGNSPFTVLPAETVAAVSTALSQLGKPFVSGTSGPDSYDCGGFTSAAWLLAGYAIPSTPETQWAAGTPVSLTDLQVGDLVFAPGGQDVGIYLGDGDVVGASAGTYQVGIRSVAAGSSATRVTLPAPAQANAALPPGGDTGACGAALPAPGPVSPAWGGYSNGQIPGEALCALGVHRHALRCDAAASYDRMSTAFASVFGSPLCITDSYRSYAQPGLGVPPQAGPGRGARHVEPWLGAGGRPRLRDQPRRVRAVDLDDGQRGPVRLRAAGLGAPGQREARAVALGVRLHLLMKDPVLPTLRKLRAGPGTGPEPPGAIEGHEHQGALEQSDGRDEGSPQRTAATEDHTAPPAGRRGRGSGHVDEGRDRAPARKVLALLGALTEVVHHSERDDPVGQVHQGRADRYA